MLCSSLPRMSGVPGFGGLSGGLGLSPAPAGGAQLSPPPPLSSSSGVQLHALTSVIVGDPLSAAAPPPIRPAWSGAIIASVPIDIKGEELLVAHRPVLSEPHTSAAANSVASAPSLRRDTVLAFSSHASRVAGDSKGADVADSKSAVFLRPDAERTLCALSALQAHGPQLIAIVWEYLTADRPAVDCAPVDVTYNGARFRCFWPAPTHAQSPAVPLVVTLPDRSNVSIMPPVWAQRMAEPGALHFRLTPAPPAKPTKPAESDPVDTAMAAAFADSSADLLPSSGAGAQSLSIPQFLQEVRHSLLHRMRSTSDVSRFAGV
jgi:hypothetical protein